MNGDDTEDQESQDDDQNNDDTVGETNDILWIVATIGVNGDVVGNKGRLERAWGEVGGTSIVEGIATSLAGRSISDSKEKTCGDVARTIANITTQQ